MKNYNHPKSLLFKRLVNLVRRYLSGDHIDNEFVTCRINSILWEDNIDFQKVKEIACKNIEEINSGYDFLSERQKKILEHMEKLWPMLGYCVTSLQDKYHLIEKTQEDKEREEEAKYQEKIKSYSIVEKLLWCELNDKEYSELLESIDNSSDLHEIATSYNWDNGDIYEKLEQFLNHPFCTKKTALELYEMGEFSEEVVEKDDYSYDWYCFGVFLKKRLADGYYD